MEDFEWLVANILEEESQGITRLSRQILKLGPTPEVLVNYGGFNQNDMVIVGHAIGKIHFDHGIKSAVICDLPNLLAKPKALYESHSHAQSTVVLTYEWQNAAPIVIPIHKQKPMGRRADGNDWICNVVASMYGKSGPHPEAQWKREGLLLWEA